MNELKHWLVLTPEYHYTEPVLDDGSGPEEYGRDIAYVEARTKREAIILGVRKLRASKTWYSYYNYAYDRSQNPYVGITAESCMCPHNKVCNCMQDDLMTPRDRHTCPGGTWCDECYAEIEADTRNIYAETDFVNVNESNLEEYIKDDMEDIVITSMGWSR